MRLLSVRGHAGFDEVTSRAGERLLQRQPFFRSTVLERHTLFVRAPAAFLQSAI